MGGMKQGYSLPVIPQLDVSYQLSLDTGGDVPQDWIIEFSDPVIGNRYGAEYLTLTIQGRDCGGIISSQHDRRFMNGLVVDDIAWGQHGACVGPNQPSDMESIDCTSENGGKGKSVH